MSHRLTILKVLVIFGLIQLLVFPANSLYIDTIWRVKEARALVNGADLFTEIRTVMPALVYLYSIPVIIWKVGGWNLSWIVSLFLTGLSVISLWFAWNILALNGKFIERKAFTLMFLFIAFWVVFGFYSGQKEQLMLMLGLPFLATSWILFQGISVRRWVLFLAFGMGLVAFTIKPFWIMVPGILWLRRLFIKREWIRVEFWMCVACGTFLFALFLIPGFRTQILYSATIYSAYRPAEDWWKLWWPVWSLLLLLFTGWKFRESLARLGWTTDLVLVSATLFGLAVFQGKGFFYHYLPTTVINLGIVFAIAVIEITREKFVSITSQLKLMAWLGILSLSVGYLFTYYFIYWKLFTFRVIPILNIGSNQIQELAGGSRVYHLSVNSDAISVIHYSGAEFGSRFFGYTWIEEMYHSGRWETLTVDDFSPEIVNGIYEDLVLNRPKVILYSDILASDPNVKLDLWKFMSEDDEIGRVLASYYEVESLVGNYRIFVLEN